MNHRRVLILLAVIALLGAACSGDGESAAGTTRPSEVPGDRDAAPGLLLFEDSFDDNDNEWVETVFEDEAEFVTVEDGALVFTSSPDAIILPTAYPGSGVDDLVSDQRVETTVTIESPGVAVVECRRAWDPDDPSRVQFYVSSSGAAGLDRIVTDGFDDEGLIDRDRFVEIDRVDHGSVDVADGQPHDLALECVGGADGGPMTVTGFVDGASIVSGETEDPTPIGHASLGLDFSGTAADGADITEVDPFTVSYTDVAFYDLGADPDRRPQGGVVVGEEFLDDSRAWLDSRDEELEDAITIADGALDLAMPAGGTSAFLTPYRVRVDDARGDQRVETTATLGPGAAAELVCRTAIDEDDFSDVRFSISADGAAAITRTPPDGVENGLLIKDALIDLDRVDAGTIDVPVDTPVSLAVECIGGGEGSEMTVTAFVDGEAVLSGTDTDPTPIGYAAVGAQSVLGAAGATAPAEAAAYSVSFEDFRLIDLSEG